MSHKIHVLECSSTNDKHVEKQPKIVKIFIGFNKIGEIGIFTKGNLKQINII